MGQEPSGGVEYNSQQTVLYVRITAVRIEVDLKRQGRYYRRFRIEARRGLCVKRLVGGSVRYCAGVEN